MCRAERDRRRELEAAVRALAQEEQKDRDEAAAELAQKASLREKARAAKHAQKEKKAQKRVAGFRRHKQKRKALAAQQREDAERARLGTLWREKFYYLLCAIMSMVVVAGLLYAWFFSSLMEPVKAAGGPVLIVLGMALLVLDLPTMCRDGSIVSCFYALCFALLGVAHLVVPLGLLFADATPALYQGFTSEGLQYERPAVDVGSFAEMASAVMQCIADSNIPVWLWVYAYATSVLPLWALADSRPFQVTSIAFGLVVAPYTLWKAGASLLLALFYPILGALASDLFLNVVGWVLGSRVTTWVRKCPPVCVLALVALGLWDGWRDDSHGRKMLVWMLASTTSWIRSVISLVLSLAYSARYIVLFLGLMVVAYKLVVRAVGALVARLALATRIDRHHLERVDGSLDVGSVASPVAILLLALGAAAGLLYYYNYLLVGVASLLWGTLLFIRIGQYYPHPLMRPACFLVALTYVTAADDQAFVLSAPLVMLGIGLDGVLGSFRFTGMAMAFALYLYGFMGLAAGLALAVVGVPVMRSAWASLRGRHCLGDGGSFTISVGTAVTTFALLINGLVLWYYDISGSLFETVGTAASAPGDAIATVSTRGTACMGSLTVYAVSLVTVAVVGVLRVRDAKSHVPNNVPGAFASNTCKDTCCGAGTSFFSRGPTFGMSFISRGPTFQIWAKDATGESIPLDVTGSTTVENLKQMIWEKVGVPAAEQFLKFGAKMLEDGRTLSDYNLQMASTVDLLLFVCGGGRKKGKKVKCDNCDHRCEPRYMNKHLQHCPGLGLKTPDATTAPDGYQQSPIPCITCSLGRKLVNNVLCGVCKYWGKLKHLGHVDYLAYFEEKRQQELDRRNEYRAATSGGMSGQTMGDDRVKWDETYDGAPNGETRLQALKRFVEETPWWHRSLHQPQFESLAQRLGVNDWQKVGIQLRLLDPANNDGYVSNLTYRRFVGACRSLATAPDKMFGRIPALTIKLVGGLVHGAIAVALSTSIRAVKGSMRRNAAGGQSREAVRQAIYRWANCDDETGGALLENDQQSGLRGKNRASFFNARWGHLGDYALGLTTDCLVQIRDRGVRAFRIAPHELSSFIGCDFGNLAKQDTVHQAFNAKSQGDGLVGDSTTRVVSRAHNNAIARALLLLVATVTLELHIKLHAGLIIVYKNLGGFHWKGNLTNAYKHFSETYDPLVFAKKSERSWGAWLQALLVEDGCGGVCDGYDICFFIGGRRVGRDLLREPMDVAIYDAIDSNLLRIARGVNWTRSYLPTVEWTSDESLLSLRTSCLEAGMGAADDALRLYKLYFEKELTAALASGRGVIEALETGYAALREGPTNLGSAATFLRTVRTNFDRFEAPAILRELAQPRRVELHTYTMQVASNEVWSAPVSVYKDVERAVSAEALAVLRSLDTRTPPSSPVRERSAGPTAFSVSAAAKRAADDSGGWTKARGRGPKPVVPPGSPEV